MATVCLVRPLLSPTDFNGYPLNLLILAAALRQEGQSVVIRDYDFLKEVDASWAGEQFASRAADDILATGCGFVGITALCSNFVLAVDLARELKRRSPAVHVTFGGPHVSLCPQETLERYPDVDTVVVGEGEITYPELIRTVEEQGNLETVLGAGFRRAGQTMLNQRRPLMQDLNQSPRPAYDLIKMEDYLAVTGDSYLEIYAGSGCPFTCTFCSTSIVWERKYRVMSEERIVGEMEHLQRTYGARKFNLIHDNLTVNKPFIHRIGQLIRERGLSIHWGFSSRIDTLDEPTAKLVAEAGCDYIFFGVESASEAIQRTIGKRLKLVMIHNAMRYCLENGIRPTTSFILGFPDEQREDVEETVRLAYRCKVGGARRSFINLLSPYTGTPLMLKAAGNLRFLRQHINSTMVRWLQDRHFQEIEADPYIYANYYFLDYAESYLQAADYSNLVDFFTICLFKYPYTITYLISDLNISPVQVHERFKDQVAGLTPEERDKIRLVIDEPDLLSLVGSEHTYGLLSALRYDQSLLVASRADGAQVLYQGGVQLPAQAGPDILTQPVVAPGVRHFLHQNARGEIVTHELTALQFILLRAQGVPVVSAAEGGEEPCSNCNSTGSPAC